MGYSDGSAPSLVTLNALGDVARPGDVGLPGRLRFMPTGCATDVTLAALAAVSAVGTSITALASTPLLRFLLPAFLAGFVRTLQLHFCITRLMLHVLSSGSSQGQRASADAVCSLCFLQLLF